MIALVLIGAGVVLLVAAGIVLRSYGRGLRIGRLLASTPEVSIDDAVARAASKSAPYLRVEGRIDGESEFTDIDDRPLVLRRTRVQVGDGERWTTVEDSREQVPFDLRTALSGIAIDIDALDEGLVVIPRESAGVASDIPDRVPAGTPATKPVRVQVEQVSTVEHAIALGVPRFVDGRPTLTSGHGRPLVLTTLEPEEAMRILGGGDRTRAMATVGFLIAGMAFVLVGSIVAVVTAVL